MFTTERVYPVLDGRSAPLELWLVSARREPSAATRAAHNDRLTRQPTFTPIEPRLFLTGMFTYLADATNIVLCADKRSVPVSMEADYKALEAAYMQARSRPGERLLVSLEGLLASRPSMEESQPPRTTLVVERFVGVWPGQRCGAKPATPPAPKR